MPSLLLPPSTDTYKGVGDPIIEFVNEDGKFSGWNCGQAAVASLLCQRVPGASYSPLMTELEANFGPDNPFNLGTSPRQVRRALKAYGLNVKTVRGQHNLKRHMPCIITFKFELMKVLGVSIPTAHWMMAYGYDDDYVYVTNWWDNRIAWPEFMAGWDWWGLNLMSVRAAAITAN